MEAVHPSGEFLYFCLYGWELGGYNYARIVLKIIFNEDLDVFVF